MQGELDQFRTAKLNDSPDHFIKEGGPTQFTLHKSESKPEASASKPNEEPVEEKSEFEIDFDVSSLPR